MTQGGAGLRSHARTRYKQLEFMVRSREGAYFGNATNAIAYEGAG